MDNEHSVLLFFFTILKEKTINVKQYCKQIFVLLSTLIFLCFFFSVTNDSYLFPLIRIDEALHWIFLEFNCYSQLVEMS